MLHRVLAFEPAEALFVPDADPWCITVRWPCWAAVLRPGHVAGRGKRSVWGRTASVICPEWVFRSAGGERFKRKGPFYSRPVGTVKTKL